MGKTALVQQFLSRINGIYLFTPRGGIDEILDSFSSDISEQTGTVIRFGHWRDFLDFLREKSKKERFVIAIDEFQRLSESYKPAISLLQHYWDNYLSKSKIMLILIGSLVGLVERLALVGDSPLFGRKTRDMKINQIPYLILRNYWKKYDEEEKIEAYGFFGGTPGYFSLIDENLTPIQNVEELILLPNARLAREPEQLLSEETRALMTYMSILAKLSRRRGLPLTKIKVRRGMPTVYLATLMKMGLVETIESLAQGDKIYAIKDEFFRFWFRFVYPRQTLLEINKGQLLVKKIIEEKNDYLSFTFEKILREIITMASGKTIKGVEIPIIDRIGSFWWKDIEVDACATARDTVIVGEAKWQKERVGSDEVLKFVRKAETIRGMLKKKKFMGVIMAKEGFTQSARKMEADYLLLLDLEDLSHELPKEIGIS